jgi:vancomycin resistance protein YoaR
VSATSEITVSLKVCNSDEISGADPARTSRVVAMRPNSVDLVKSFTFSYASSVQQSVHNICVHKKLQDVLLTLEFTL